MCRSVRTVGASTLFVLFALCLDGYSQDKKPEGKPEATPVAAPQDKKPEAADKKPEAQDKKPEAADKKPEAAPSTALQERIDIGATLDSWYKVLQGNDAIGYYHEILQRAQAGQPWRYRYDSDAEIEVMIPDPKDARKQISMTESLRIRAQLDDTYAPFSMERSDNRNEAQVVSTVLTEDSGRKIDVVLGPTERHSFNV